MLRLSRNGIRNLASSDLVYSRGLAYYKNNRVINAAFSKNLKQYKLTVKGNYNYQVVITENDDGSFEHSCNCPLHVKEKGACKHVVAGLLFLLKYQEKSKIEAPQTPEEKRAFQVLDYFANQEEARVNGEIFRIEATITIPKIIKQEEKAILTISVGNSRLYKVQTLKKFIVDIITGQNIILGKEFKYLSGESEFDKASMKLLDFLIEIYEMQEIIDSGVSANLFSKMQLILTKNMLKKLLRILGDTKSAFNLSIYSKSYEKVRFIYGNPKLKYILDVYDDAILLDYKNKDSIIPLCDDGELLFHDDFVYMPDKKFIRNFIPFYYSLGGDKGSLIFRGENKQRFLEEVLPRLHDTMDIDIPETLIDIYRTYDFNAVIYFDKYNNYIKAELKFVYGDYEFNCFEDPRTDSIILVRQREKEYEIMHMLESLDFEPHSRFYLLKNDTSIYSFLTGGIETLKGMCDMYYSEDFKRFSIKSGGNLKVGLRMNSDINLLEMNLEYDGIPSNELKELFNSLHIKKKYYRLKDGSFIDLESDDMSSIVNILDNLNIPLKNAASDTIKLEKLNAFYLNEAVTNEHFIVEKDEDFTKFIENITNSKDIKGYEIPDGITAKLRPYQINGYKWLRMLADNNLGGILADDMGLGKTLQSIVYIKSRISKSSKFLVVCPTSLVYNWSDEFENFSPSVKTVIVTGNPAERQKLIEEKDNYDVVITSYPLIRRDIMYYKNIIFDTVFIDEAQFIKNAASLNAQSVKLLNAEHRFALTGTPIENSLSELWSIFDFIMPNYLMTHTKFFNKYEKYVLKDDNSVLEDLNKRIRPFVLRRMKKDVLKELPEKIEEKITTELTEEQKKIYLSYMANFRNEFYDEIDASGIEKNQIKILAALTRLRQICCHPSTFLEDYNGGSGKLNLLTELLDNAIANGHRVLIFSQFTTMLKIIADVIKKKNIDFFYLEGSTSIEDRMEYVKHFNNGEKDVFLISLKAGGTGLNLTSADMVIHYDPWWNPAVETQATDRVYRIGQEKNVHVIKLLTKGTIEEKIYKLQCKKQDLSDSVIQSKEVFLTSLTKSELEDIFKMPSDNL